MGKEIIYSKRAPEPVGPYSQAIRSQGLIFVSGQIPLDTKTGKVVTDDIKAATRLVLDNLKSILSSTGLSLDKVVKTTIYLTDLSLFSEVNAVYEEYFSKEPPARSCVGVSSLPKGVGIEIEAIAVNDG